MSAALGALLVVVAHGAYAIPVTTSFTASGFAPPGAPANQVSGTIVWEAASLTSTIDSLTSIDLTIGGHAYTLAEVGFESSQSMDLIAGALNGLNTLMPDTDDFFLVLDRGSSLTPRYLAYAATGFPGTDFTSFNFTSFSVTANAVPEPSTLALLGLAFAGIGFARRRRMD